VDTDASGAPLSIQCTESEIRVLSGTRVVVSQSYAAEEPHAEPYAPVPVRNAAEVIAALRPDPLANMKAQLRACYNKALQRDPSLSGELHGELLLAPDGVIKDVRLDPKRTTMKDHLLVECVKTNLKGTTTKVETNGKEALIVF
jgi:hypothetical protein